jgi:MFS family permease
MSARREPLFTPRFFLMCGFTFTVFVSAFMLLPTAPFRIIALGGSESAAGLFLGFLTYASALSAPFTGALADRVGRRRTLIVSSLAVAVFAAAYALTGGYRLLLALVPLHGVFWSGLLAASAAYTTDLIPESRRAEGIGYWGLSTIVAVAFAPSLGFFLLHRGWPVLCTACCGLNLLMAGIASGLRETRPPQGDGLPEGSLVEWRVLLTSFALFLYSFGYGALTSFVALYAEANGVAPKGIYFIVLALTILATRPVSGPLADRIGHRRVLLPCLVLVAAGLGLLALGGTRPWLFASAVVFGSGFGTAYPVYAALVMKRIARHRRAAAFGSILAAFDTGIGSGSITTGLLVERVGFSGAFAVAALLASLSLPYFLFAERRFLHPPERAHN